MAEDFSYPVHDINLVLRACDPGEPLEHDDDRRYDFTALRGSSVLQELQRLLLALPPGGTFHHQILCGHRGSGKSTELLELKWWAENKGFLAVRREVDRELGLIALQFSDLYLLTAMAVEAEMQNFGVSLDPKAVKPVVEWFAEITQEDKASSRSELSVEAGAQLEAGIPLLGKIFAKFFSGVKVGSEQTETVRRRLRNFPDTLVDLTRDLLESANAALAAAGRPRGLLLILDNLDRYETSQIEGVLMRGATLMRRLACHALFTMPIDMEYAPQGPIHDEYGHSFVLPMLPLRAAGMAWSSTVADSGYRDAAVDAVLDALRQRLAVDELFESDDDARLLVKMSGGCVRDLMHLVTLTFRKADDKFTHAAVVAGIQQYRTTLVGRLGPADYERLATIARRELVPRDELTARLLFHRFALEYIEDDKPWLDVHPLIVETEGFQHAVAG